MKTRPDSIVISSGEPAGIGPDLCIKLIQQALPCPVTLVGDRELFLQRADELKLPFNKHLQTDLINVALRAPVQSGQLDTRNAQYVLDMLDVAVHGCLDGQFHAMVTAPVHKGVINDAAITFTGHTEYLAEQCQRKQVVMMLATEGLRVALVTTHLPLSEVSDAITADKLTKVITILHQELQQRFQISNPCIYVCGLNPHAGEQGHLGQEEIKIIEPTLETLRRQGMNLIGPLPADTLFTDKYLQHADAVLAMYHDQGLPVLKHIGFGKAINITLGLPIIRTSVDHGTALELAGSGNIQTGSLLLALQTALEMK